MTIAGRSRRDLSFADHRPLPSTVPWAGVDDERAARRPRSRRPGVPGRAEVPVRAHAFTGLLVGARGRRDDRRVALARVHPGRRPAAAGRPLRHRLRRDGAGPAGQPPTTHRLRATIRHLGRGRADHRPLRRTIGLAAGRHLRRHRSPPGSSCRSSRSSAPPLEVVFIAASQTVAVAAAVTVACLLSDPIGAPLDPAARRGPDPRRAHLPAGRRPAGGALPPPRARRPGVRDHAPRAQRQAADVHRQRRRRPRGGRHGQRRPALAGPAPARALVAAADVRAAPAGRRRAPRLGRVRRRDQRPQEARRRRGGHGRRRRRARACSSPSGSTSTWSGWTAAGGTTSATPTAAAASPTSTSVRPTDGDDSTLVRELTVRGQLVGQIRVGVAAADAAVGPRRVRRCVPSATPWRSRCTTRSPTAPGRCCRNARRTTRCTTRRPACSTGPRWWPRATPPCAASAATTRSRCWSSTSTGSARSTTPSATPPATSCWPPPRAG